MGEGVWFCDSGLKIASRPSQAVRATGVMFNPAEYCHAVTEALQSQRFLSVKGKDKDETG